jgi:N-methylhydantoinase B
VLRRPDGTEETLPSMFSTTIGDGDVFVHRTAGGGGWGEPRERDPRAIADDVADGKVTPDAARRVYGTLGDEVAR